MPRAPAHLTQASNLVVPMVQREHGERGIDGIVVERQ
jgi:hypothetical protein